MSKKRIAISSVRAVLATMFLLLLLAGPVYGVGEIRAVYDDRAKNLSVTFDNNYASGWMIDLYSSEAGQQPTEPFAA